MSVGPWTALAPWSPPPEARYVRHFLANRLLPLSVAVELLDGAPSDAVDLARSGVSALEGDLALLDLCTQPTIASGSFALGDLGVSGAPDVRVPHVVHLNLALAALPVAFDYVGLERESVVMLLSTEHSDFAVLASEGIDVYPWIVESCGLALPAVVAGASAAGGQLAVGPTGALRLSLPRVV